MRYELTIEGKPNNIVIKSLGKNDSVIRKVDFLLSQKELETNARSENLVHTLVIEGELKDTTKSATRQLLEWSLQSESSKAYKNVTLIVKKDADIVLRNYYLKDMYCVSYQENFCETAGDGGEDTYGSFVLKMRQKKGSIETINVQED